MKTTKAKNVSGVLCRSINGRYFFRVYSSDKKEFKDYDLLHSDLSITITDNEATLYESEEKNYIDHSPETLGKVKNR
jgi:hypothetical protein